MKLITHAEMWQWLEKQGWLSLPNPHAYHLAATPSQGLAKYEFTIEKDSASVGCDMAPLLLDSFDGATFPGALFWIAGVFGSSASATPLFLLEHLLRAQGVATPKNWLRGSSIFLEPGDFDVCVALVAMAIMFGWDTNLAIAGRNFLLTTYHDLFPAVTTDQLGPESAEVVKDPAFEVRIHNLSES